MERTRSFRKSFNSGSKSSKTSTALKVIRIYMAAKARRYLAKKRTERGQCPLRAINEAP